MSYRFLEHIAKADTAFEAEAATLPELFIEGAKALFATMVDLSSVGVRERYTLTLENEQLEQLFFDWLSELVYMKDKEYVLFSQFDVKVKQEETYKLSAVLLGEKINPQKHKLVVDVKAVTYHMFTVKKRKGKWYARIIVDV